MKSSFLVISAFALIVACGTRDTRQKPFSGGSSGEVTPSGGFQGKVETDAAKACTAVDSKSASIDKDLKKDDQFVYESVVSSGKSIIKTKHQIDVVETTATEVKLANTIIIDGGQTLKNESTCKLVSDGTMDCRVSANDGKEDVKAKDFSLEDMPCKVSEESQPKVEVFSGPFKMTGGQSVNAVRKVETKTGQITCKDEGGKTLNVGHGKLIQDEYRSADVVNIPQKSNCQEELIFMGYRMVTDDGRNVSTMRVEVTKAPIRKK